MRRRDMKQGDHVRVTVTGVVQGTCTDVGIEKMTVNLPGDGAQQCTFDLSAVGVEVLTPPDLCEWNPVDGVPSMTPPAENDCGNEAELLVGVRDNFRLCADCAALPVWRRHSKKRIEKRRRRRGDATSFLQWLKDVQRETYDYENDEDIQWLVDRYVREFGEVPETFVPRHDDDVDVWLAKACRSYSYMGGNVCAVLASILSDYRLHADTGKPLSVEVVERG